MLLAGNGIVLLLSQTSGKDFREIHGGKLVPSAVDPFVIVNSIL